MGPKLEDFRILSTIGSGSHGTVRKVQRRHDGQILVWKELNYGAMTEAEKKGLVLEVNLLRELRHPNIVRFLHHIVDRRATTLYILMEYCGGGDLKRLISRCRQTSTFIEEGFIWRVLKQICEALKVCHDRERNSGRLVLHRDIKPANVFLDYNGTVKLGDFGLARTLNSETSFATTFVGTPYYMSPEVMLGRDYNEMSDMWSLGCLIYELCALHPPFKANTHKQLAAKIKEARYDSIPIQYSCELKKMLSLLLTYEDFLRPTALMVLHHSALVKNVGFLGSAEEEEELGLSIDPKVLRREKGREKEEEWKEEERERDKEWREEEEEEGRREEEEEEGRREEEREEGRREREEEMEDREEGRREREEEWKEEEMEKWKEGRRENEEEWREEEGEEREKMKGDLKDGREEMREIDLDTISDRYVNDDREIIDDEDREIDQEIRYIDENSEEIDRDNIVINEDGEFNQEIRYVDDKREEIDRDSISSDDSNIDNDKENNMNDGFETNIETEEYEEIMASEINIAREICDIDTLSEDFIDNQTALEKSIELKPIEFVHKNQNYLTVNDTGKVNRDIVWQREALVNAENTLDIPYSIDCHRELIELKRKSGQIKDSPLTETYRISEREAGKHGESERKKREGGRKEGGGGERETGGEGERMKVEKIKLECACGGMTSRAWRERLLSLREAEVSIREREVVVRERERDVREREHRVTAMEREAKQHLIRAQIYLRNSRPRQGSASPHRPPSDLDTTVSADPGDEICRTTARPDPLVLNNPFLEMRGVTGPPKHVSFRETAFKSNTLDNPKSRRKRGSIFGLVDRVVEGRKEGGEEGKKEGGDSNEKALTKPVSQKIQTRCNSILNLQTKPHPNIINKPHSNTHDHKPTVPHSNTVLSQNKPHSNKINKPRDSQIILNTVNTRPQDPSGTKRRTNSLENLQRRRVESENVGDFKRKGELKSTERSDRIRVTRRQGSLETLHRRREAREGAEDKENRVERGCGARNVPEIKGGLWGRGQKVVAGRLKGRETRDKVKEKGRSSARVLQFYNVV